LKAREKIKETWRRISITKRSKQRHKITSTHHTIDGVRIQCNDRNSTEKTYINEYESRVTQCLFFPFLQPPLLSTIGLLADKPSVQQIFDGAFNTPLGTEYYATKLINELKKRENSEPPPSTKITAKENSEAGKKQRPSTASEPSTLGFPHFIIGAQDQEVSELDAIIRSVPYETGTTPESFLPITDFPLKKNAESTDIENTRLIQLFDARFNMNNKKLGRDTI
jgi:hypothetical protein